MINLILEDGAQRLNDQLISFFLSIEFSELDSAAWQASNQALEQVEWAAEKAMEITWEDVWRICETIVDVGGVDAGKVVCKTASFIPRLFLVITYFVAHTVSTD